MKVMAKMRVARREELNWSYGADPGRIDGIVITLQAVYSNDKSDPNYSWSKATPSGECRLQIDNPECFGSFKLGEEYLMEFTKVEPSKS